MSRVAVVIRELPGHVPVLSTIIDESHTTATSREEIDNALQSKAQDYIVDFKMRLPEFKNAKFYISVCDKSDYSYP